MKLEQLKMLKEIAEQGSLKEASKALFKTQPAISQGIKQLENQLGIVLFNREGYRLTLTENGEKIYQHSLRLLNEANQIKQLAAVLKQGNESSITLAIEASYNLKKVLPIMEEIQHEFPHTQIIIKQEYINGALEAVKSNNADFAITNIDMRALQSGLFETTLLNQGSLCNVASPVLLSRHPNLHSAIELKNEYQIVVQDSGNSSGGVQYSVQMGQRCWYVNDFSTKHTLILSGIGWGRLPEFMVKDDIKNNKLVAVDLIDFENSVALNYQAIKLKSRLLGPVADKLWHYLSVLAETA